MIKLGITFNDVLQSSNLTSEEIAALQVFFDATLLPDYPDYCGTDIDELFGGYVFILEDTPDDLELLQQNDSLDLADYLNENKTFAAVGCANNDAGGDVWLLRDCLLAKYPDIHEQIRMSQKGNERDE